MNDAAFLGRQPLFGPTEQTVAYRLFVADGSYDANPFGDADLACRRMLRTVIAANLEELIAGKDLWVPFTADALSHGLFNSLPPGRTVLTLTPHEMARPEAGELIDRVRRLGYRVGIDTTAVDLGDLHGVDPFVALERLGIGELDAIAIRLHGNSEDAGRRVAVEAARRRMVSMAIGIDSPELAMALDAVFDLRGGSFIFERVSGGPGGSVDRFAAMQLLAELEKPNGSFEDVEKVISRDPSLVLRMLSLVNSGLFSLPKRIDSTRSALVLLGLRNVRQLALAVTLHSVTSVPAELTLTSLIRARQCELLATELGVRSEPAFTVGLLSLVGVFAGTSTEEALAALPLTTEVVNAITRHTGLLGEVLDAVLCCEANRLTTACEIVDAISPASAGPAGNINLLASTWLEAVKWAERLRSDVSDRATAGRR